MLNGWLYHVVPLWDQYWGMISLVDYLCRMRPTKTFSDEFAGAYDGLCARVHLEKPAEFNG